MASYQRPICNCPDYLQSREGYITARFPSRYFSSNWSDSTGIVDVGGTCKHVFSVLVIRDELDKAYPDGVPYRPKIDDISKIANKPVSFRIDRESSIIKPRE